MRIVRSALVAATLAAFSLEALPAEAGFFQDLGNFLREGGASDPSRGDSFFFSRYERQTVTYPTKEAPGTIVIDTNQKFLFFVLGKNKAIRYGVGVGREGFGWHGVVHVGRKEEWPDWRPPPEMIAREREQNGRVIPAFMKGGVGNPLGARALYLFNTSGDTQYRIHGTSEPWTIGHNVSSGCIRLVNADVEDLYTRAKVGAKVIVL
jgi:lipoprotein-anchoring transpeptidase ErfK/SrfK